MKQYYYRDLDDETRGPVTLDQLSAMMVEGLVDPTTLVAEAGGNTWVALGGLLSFGLNPHEYIPNCIIENQALCPKCGAALPIVNGSPSTRCLSCGFRLAPSHGGLIPNFFFVLRKSFCLRGRTTRREFLFFQIVFLAVSALLGYLSYVFLSLGIESAARGNEGDWLLFGGISLGALVLFWLVAALPQFSLTVRRLHDVNRGAVWVFSHALTSLFFVLSLAYLGLCLLFLVAKGMENRMSLVASHASMKQGPYHLSLTPPGCFETHAHYWFDHIRYRERAQFAKRLMQALGPLYDFVDRTKGLEFDVTSEQALMGSKGIEIISMLGEWRNVPPYGMRTAMIVNVCCMAMLPLLSLALLVMVVSEGHRGENRYGPDLNIPHP